MTSGDYARLIVLSAIWGFSFLFMRVLSPILGAILTADLRLLIAGVALCLYFFAIKFPLDWKSNWRHYVMIGAVSAAIPFLCFTFSAQHIPASYSAILNASSPLFSAIFSAVWLGAPFTWLTAGGLLLGIGGVALVANVKPAHTDEFYHYAVFACILASVCYSLGAVYIRKFAKHIPSRAIAAGNQLTAGILLLPLLPFGKTPGALSPLEVFYLLSLALLCSAVAYVLYYRLIADIGATRALTVTFLAPLFAMLWAKLFLHEAITPAMLLGCFLVIVGTYGISKT